MPATDRPPLEDMRGFSLIELLIGMAILIIILGIISGIAGVVQRGYSQHRPRMEAVNNASAAMDTLVRLLRMAGNNPSNPQITGLQAVNPDPDGDGQYNSIRIQADWNPANGSLNDTYEDITFTVQNGNLLKRELADATPVPFLENIGSLTFTYFDRNNNLITNAVAESGRIARVDISLATQSTGTTPMIFTSSAHIRGR